MRGWLLLWSLSPPPGDSETLSQSPSDLVAINAREVAASGSLVPNPLYARVFHLEAAETQELHATCGVTIARVIARVQDLPEALTPSASAMATWPQHVLAVRG